MKTDAPAASASPSDDGFISAEQVADLMHIAKLKGYATKEAAVRFLNEVTGLNHFTKMPADEFDLYKRKVNGSFAKPGSEVPF